MGIKAEGTMSNEAGMVNYVNARDDASPLTLNEYEEYCKLAFETI